MQVMHDIVGKDVNLLAGAYMSELAYTQSHSLVATGIHGPAEMPLQASDCMSSNDQLVLSCLTAACKLQTHMCKWCIGKWYKHAIQTMSRISAEQVAT